LKIGTVISEELAASNCSFWTAYILRVEAASLSKVSGSIYRLKQCLIPQDLSLIGVGALVKSVLSGGLSVLANCGGESVQQAQQKHV
jgi:hypothetical protein